MFTRNEVEESILTIYIYKLELELKKMSVYNKNRMRYVSGKKYIAERIRYDVSDSLTQSIEDVAESYADEYTYYICEYGNSQKRIQAVLDGIDDILMLIGGRKW